MCNILYLYTVYIFCCCCFYNLETYIWYITRFTVLRFFVFNLWYIVWRVFFALMPDFITRLFKNEILSVPLASLNRIAEIMVNYFNSASTIENLETCPCRLCSSTQSSKCHVALRCFETCVALSAGVSQLFLLCKHCLFSNLLISVFLLTLLNFMNDNLTVRSAWLFPAVLLV